MQTVNTDRRFTHPSLLDFNIEAIGFDDTNTKDRFDRPSSSTPDLIIERLVRGNQQFVELRDKQIQRNSICLSAVAQGQTPFAAVLNYAQLSTSTEEIFGRKFGELFVINSPGQITNSQEISSIEYGALMLGIEVVVVVGDEICHHQQPLSVPDDHNSAHHPQHLKLTIKRNTILLSRRDRSPSLPEMPLSGAANILTQVDRLKASPLLRQFVQAGNLKIVGALYEPNQGTVTMLPS